MAMDLTALANTRRLLIEAQLRPAQGHRFQPTGFPDLGAATYQAGNTACLLLESAQSMANRMESTIWDEGTQSLIPEAGSLSAIQVNDSAGSYLTSSVLEAHRLNSPYIERSEGVFFKETLTQAIGAVKSHPIDRPKFLGALLQYDVNTLLHGVFLESLDGRLRIPRALSAFIEAEGIQIAASGGVKNDRVTATSEEGRSAKEGFGNVPYHREEFTAEKITAFFSIDLQQIRAYGLGDDVSHMLTVLALFKTRSLLDGSLRLRTACDLELIDENVVARKPAGFELPSLSDLTEELPRAIDACKDRMEFTTIVFKK